MLKAWLAKPSAWRRSCPGSSQYCCCGVRFLDSRRLVRRRNSAAGAVHLRSRIDLLQSFSRLILSNGVTHRPALKWSWSARPEAAARVRTAAACTACHVANVATLRGLRRETTRHARGCATGNQSRAASSWRTRRKCSTRRGYWRGSFALPQQQSTLRPPQRGGASEFSDSIFIRGGPPRTPHSGRKINTMEAHILRFATRSKVRCQLNAYLDDAQSIFHPLNETPAKHLPKSPIDYRAGRLSRPPHECCDRLSCQRAHPILNRPRELCRQPVHLWNSRGPRWRNHRMA